MQGLVKLDAVEIGVDSELMTGLLAALDGWWRQPLVVADGIGVDSTAMLILLKRLKIRPDAVLFADTGAEKDETYEYLAARRRWLAAAGFPDLVVVRYVVSDYKHWPPYHALDQNCLTNGTLPSLAFGFKSCSIKWKVVPQNRWTESWPPAVAAWADGKKVLKAIGFDAGPKDRKRYAHAEDVLDPAYEYVYPLALAGWDRERCIEVICEEGEPVPSKSACYMCPSVQPEELLEYKKKYLRWIVVMEARAEPRLEKIQGLWRNGTKGTRGGRKKPGKITDFIREKGLLPVAEIDRLVARAPLDILDAQDRFANGLAIEDWRSFLDSFAGVDEGPCGARPGPGEVALVQLGRRNKSAPR